MRVASTWKNLVISLARNPALRIFGWRLALGVALAHAAKNA
jgi:hypothetical protein